MGSLLSVTVLGALLMFTPLTARQTTSIEVNISQNDSQIVTSYAQNSSTNEPFREITSSIKPVQIERETVVKDIAKVKAAPVQTAAYSKPKPSTPPVPAPTPRPEPQPISGPAELEALVERYAVQYGARKDIMMIIMKCESGYNPNAVNGSFGGLYQFMTSTWISNRNAMGLDPNPALRFNAEEAIRTAAFKMGRDGYGAWPACSTKAFSQLGV